MAFGDSFQSGRDYNAQRWGDGRQQDFTGYKPSDKDLQRGVGNAMGGQFNLANMMEGFGNEQFKLAGPAYGRALGFYGDLMGSAQSQRQALSPAIRNINEGGVGARSAIRNRMGRSGAREMAFAEEGRQRQGDINSMMAGAPLIGAEGTSRLSAEGLQRVMGSSALASGAYASAGGTGLGALDLERQRKENNRNRWAQIGGGIASLFGI
jgi:hypothetical protein